MQALLPSSRHIDETSSPAGDNLIAVNTTPYARRELVEISIDSARARNDEAIQLNKNGAAYVMFENEEGGALSGAVSMKHLKETHYGAARGKLLHLLVTEGY